MLALSVLLGIFVAAGVFLVPWAATAWDSARLGAVGYVALEPDDSLVPVDATLAQRAALLGDSSKGLMALQVETGNRFDSTSVYEQLSREIEGLISRGLLPTLDVENLSEAVVSQSAMLYLRTDEPGVNTIIWNVQLAHGDFRADFFLEDESGKILGYSLVSPEPAEAVEATGPPQAEGFGTQWAAYLGLELYPGSETTKPPVSDEGAVKGTDAFCAFELGSQEARVAYLFYRASLTPGMTEYSVFFQKNEQEAWQEKSREGS